MEPSRLKPDEVLLLGVGPVLGAVSIFLLVDAGLSAGWVAALQRAATPLMLSLAYLALGLRRLREQRAGAPARPIAGAPPRVVLAAAAAVSVAVLTGWWLLLNR